MGIRREMTVSGLSRLIPTECEVWGSTLLIRAHYKYIYNLHMVTNQVGGWPPLSVTFQTEEDRQEVLARAASLVTDRASNIQVTQ